jgi:hypothetical protein
MPGITWQIVEECGLAPVDYPKLYLSRACPRFSTQITHGNRSYRNSLMMSFERLASSIAFFFLKHDTDFSDDP